MSKPEKSFLCRRCLCFAIANRRVSLNWVPILGEAHSVVAVVRQPVDIDNSKAAQIRLLTRLAMAVNGRFPPWRGLVIGLTSLVLTPEPIEPADDAMLREVLGVKLGRMRVVPFGLIRVNLGQEAIALAVNSSPDELFTEPTLLADPLCEKFQQRATHGGLTAEQKGRDTSFNRPLIEFPVERDFKGFHQGSGHGSPDRHVAPSPPADGSSIAYVSL